MPGTTGPNFGLVSGWAAGETGYDAQLNRDLRDLDAWAQIMLKGVQSAPPVGPANGDRYGITVGTGAWSGHDGEVAVWRAGAAAWEFMTPKGGWAAWREDLGRLDVWTDVGWVAVIAPGDRIDVKLFGARGDGSTDDTGSIQAALDALALTGGTVLFPRGEYLITDTLVAPDAMPIQLLGDGVTSTSIRMAASVVNVDMIRLQGDHCSCRDLRIIGPGVAGTGRGIVLGSATMDTTDIHLADLFIEDTAAEALYLEGIGAADRGHITILTRVQRCRFRRNLSQGASSEAMSYIGVTCAGARFEDCAWTDFKGRAMFMDIADGISFERCSFDAPADTAGHWLQGSRCRYVKIKNCWFEVSNGNVNYTQRRIWIGGHSYGVAIEDCNFESDYGYPVAISIGGGSSPDPTAGVRIVNCWARVGNVTPFGVDQIYIGPDATKVCIYGGGVMDAAYPTRALYDWAVQDASGVAVVEPGL